MGKFLSHRDEQGLQIVLHMMALFPDDDECIRRLKDQHNYILTQRHLQSIRETKAEKVQEARESVATFQEKVLSSDLADNAQLAGMAVLMATKATIKQLEEGKVKDPSKVARDLADVQAKSIDKSRLLQDKPTTITAKRSMEDDIRFLEEKGIIPRQIEVTVDADSDCYSED